MSIHLVASLIGFSLFPSIIFFLSGSLNLVGDKSQEYPLLPGFAVGGILFSMVGGFLGKGIAFRFISWALFVLTAILLFYFSSTSFVMTYTDGIVYAILSTGICLPFTYELSSYGSPEFYKRRKHLKTIFQGILPLIATIVLAEIYVAMGQSLLQLVIVGILSVLIVLLLAAVLISSPARSVPGGGSA